ncbi:MAG: hypothetical protein QOG20_4114 [Pseudonocardiales bacterium]|uniref:hypothetical protein n=1 Tax=Pseudonocardia sp. TaxID=60912 RepID=UPI0026118171|nr:hypothetical protein [Pseudonocardia sp.]MCW2718057.1 hypothetical protein [Pseudonocardia sp.]MDT7612704.1 hypothetical protein [Pseudonocardiales bacterium]MDT7708507.1 hypothetical protein [Pseudonocardiales bacterium]
MLEDPHPEREHLRLATITSGLLAVSAPTWFETTWLLAMTAVLIALALGPRAAQAPPQPPARDKV